MTDLLTQANIFVSEILILLDQGESITIEEFVEKIENKDLIRFIGQKFGYKNANSTPQNQQKLEDELAKIYVSENEAYNRNISNNGLVYLLDCLFSIVHREAYDYKWNYEDMILKRSKE